MKKVFASLLALTVLFTGLTACNNADSSDLQDGTYVVEDQTFGGTGWQETLELVIRDGVIEDATWTSLNEEGLNKLDDEEYQETMTNVSGLGPQDFIPALESDLLDTQNPDDVEVISGATGTAEKFIDYANRALEAAREGNTDTIVVDNTEE